MLTIRASRVEIFRRSSPNLNWTLRFHDYVECRLNWALAQTCSSQPMSQAIELWLKSASSQAVSQLWAGMIWLKSGSSQAMSIAFGVAQCQQHKGHILHDLKVFTYWCCNYWVVVAQSSNCKLKCLHLTHALCMGFIPWSLWCLASCPKTFRTWNHVHHGPQFKDRGTPLQKKLVTHDPPG